ncbi:DUF6415 family natural product biosynthesis protein [Streptomyces purpurascens]|uniref:DUF6415 family natural product biosynthesis protein n=1 Tax=Streptomyces purpurascens TaxID=1924 RepID=UPI0033F5CBAD
MDIETMQQAAQDVVDNGAKITDADELETIILLLRGMIMVLIPEVEKGLAEHPKNHTPSICARAGITEARTRAHIVPGSDIPQLVGHAQRLARGVLALIRHHRKLGGTA